MSLNPEIGMFVVKWITRKGKADAVERAEGSSRRYAKVSIADTTGVLEQGMFSEGLPGNLGEPVISLYRCRGRLPEKKSLAPSEWASCRRRVRKEHELQEADKVLAGERQTKPAKTGHRRSESCIVPRGRRLNDAT